MNHVFRFVYSFSLVLMTLVCCSGQESGMNRLTCPSVAELNQVFREGPAKGYGPAEAVFWNERLNEKIITTLLDELKSQHIREFFFYPTFGLDVAYLSEDFFKYYEFTLAEAKRRGMDVWLYDEFSWPSGFAGGLLGEALPDAGAKGLYFSDVKKLDVLPEYLLAVYQRELDGTFRNITSQARKDGKLSSGDYKLAFLKYSPSEPRLCGGFYCDMLKKGVTEKFIELTHKAYQKHSGTEFGRAVRGIFTDEMTLGRAGGVLWTDDLPDRFEKKFHAPIWGILPLLHKEAELALPDGRLVDAAEAQHHHKSVLLDLDIERWCKPIFEYCETNKLEFCGHYQEHWWAFSSTNPDVAAMYVWQQRPTIDIIFNQWSQKHRGQAGNIRIVRELGSLASQLGRAKTFAETCGASGWGLLPLDIKRLTDWETVLGITNMAEMGPQLSVRGGRKFDEGPSIYYHMPWWEEYHRLVDYETRLSWLSSQGKQNNDLLVLQPTTSLWLYANKHNICEPMAQAFCDMLIELEERQLEYDLGSEYVIDLLGSIDQGKLVVGKADYSMILIPENFENIERKTLVLLDQFVRGGGALVVLGKLPARVDGRKLQRCDATTQKLYAKLFAPEIVRTKLQFVSDSFPVKLAPGVWQTDKKNFLNIPWNASTYAMTKVPTSAESPFLPMYQKGQIANTPWLYHLRREMKDGEFLFFVNSDRDKTRSFSFFTCPNTNAKQVWSSVDLLDLATGTITPYPSCPVKQNGKIVTRLDVTLPPCGSLALTLTAGTLAAPETKSAHFVETVIKPLALPQIKRLHPNVHVLDYCSLKLGDKQFQEDYFIRTDQKLWRHYGFDTNPWWHLPQRHHDL
ncbi:MAG: glycosyl hydrolase, partial [Thermoguttaceae bacterium]|nr:glycosyl hydrolase [Thermoguttaceae bacterium]